MNIELTKSKSARKTWDMKEKAKIKKVYIFLKQNFLNDERTNY